MTITMTDGNTPTNNNTIQIPSADILHLLQSHLTECGLHATSSALRAESGGLIGLPGLFPSSKGTLVASCQDGRWGEVLQLLENLDLERSRRSFLEDYSFSIEDNGDSRDDGGNDEVGQQSCSKIFTPLEKAVAMVHEMTILELADQNEVDLAYATLRMCSEMMDRTLPLNDDNDDENNNNAASTVGMILSRSGDVERRITALSSMRRLSSSSNNNNNTASSSSTTTTTSRLPANYYGPSNPSKQKRRDQIAKLLKRHIPEIPPERLTTLLQQSIKWQCHTGKFPTVQRLFRPTEEDNGDDDEHLADEGDGTKKKKKKKRKDKNVEQKFDLVLGNVDVNDRHGGKKRKRDGEGGGSLSSLERIPSRPYQTIRLGKKSYIESACFLPDGKGLVTGSSDGFIEIWGEVSTASSSSSSAPSSRKDGNTGGVGVAAAANTTTTNTLNDLNSLLSTDVDFEKLRTSDLPYQRDDDLMMHESSVLAVTVSHDGTLLGTTSSDGTVCVWKISDGKLLRKMERAHGGTGGMSDKGAAVTCIQFSPDSSKILTGGHDSTCREFGLLASRMLKEFRGHNSYVNCCSYVLLPPSVAGVGNNGSSRHGGDGRFLAVVTASADGSVRLWDGRTAEPIREITPPIPTTVTAVVHDKDSIVRSKSVHTVVHLHSQANAMVVVPRCDRAYLMSYSGEVLRTYVRDDVQGSEFLAAVVGSSERYLFVAADDGKCVVFDIHTGKVEKIIRSFAEDCSSGGRSGKACDISGLVCHPHRGFIGGYSSDKGQKRGILGLWK